MKYYYETQIIGFPTNKDISGEIEWNNFTQVVKKIIEESIKNPTYYFIFTQIAFEENVNDRTSQTKINVYQNGYILVHDIIEEIMDNESMASSESLREELPPQTTEELIKIKEQCRTLLDEIDSQLIVRQGIENPPSETNNGTRSEEW